MKKKILFMLINMNIGGTEKALLTMLAEIDKAEYDVTLLMLEEYGGFLDQIPNWVNVKYIKNFKELKKIINNPIHVNAIDLFKNKEFVKATKMVYLYLIYKITKEQTKFYEYILNDYPVIDEEYDMAVAYAGPMDFISYFVVHKIKSKKKVQWIHFDVTKIGFNKKFAMKIYEKFDNIFVVSNEAKNKLHNLLPCLNDKTEVFFNIISPKTIIKMSKEGSGFDDNFKGIRILTVGRLSKEKGQDLTIPVLAKLKANGYNVKWYCIGEGNARHEYERIIKQHKLENDYLLMGNKTNPYPFMKDCDIYVQPSRYEGYCITLSEIRCFNKPIIATKFTGANEQIKHNQTGVLVDINEDEIYEYIKELIDNIALKNKISKNLKNEQLNEKTSLEKLYTVLE
ncbi:MAG: glycosyltransferase [Terrisporobacter othiniensis]|nr:glycosyltransferase [Terrisporobacter othiniensis]MDU6996758.1 glycosyltransferase [Terrisporobacter othiniensis]